MMITASLRRISHWLRLPNADTSSTPENHANSVSCTDNDQMEFILFGTSSCSAPARPTPDAAPGLTFEEAWHRTLAARRDQGLAAAAPELDPYVDATHWPSGVPLPRPLLQDAARRRRCPGWPQSAGQRWMACLLVLCVFQLGSQLLSTLSGASSCSVRGLFWLNLCMLHLVAAGLAVFAAVQVGYDVERCALERHVKVLYRLMVEDTVGQEEGETLRSTVDQVPRSI